VGRAEELFNRIRNGDASEIHRMIGTPVVEELFLDYKRSSTPLPGAKLSDEDRKNFANGISGFANSEGDVIIWGVDCRQTKHGDVPTKAVPITHPVALKTLFENALGGLTLPAHASVENIAMSNTDGFVITYVPADCMSPIKPIH
jgi:hypothetical protein